jgi:hypothetical protein
MATSLGNVEEERSEMVKKTIYVSNETGCDKGGDGSEEKPFKTTPHAIFSFLIENLDHQVLQCWRQQPELTWLPTVYLERINSPGYEPLAEEQIVELFYQECAKIRIFIAEWKYSEAKRKYNEAKTKYSEAERKYTEVKTKQAKVEEELCITETELAKVKRDCNDAELRIDMIGAFADLTKKK